MTDLPLNLEGVRNSSHNGTGLSSSLITINRCRTILSRWTGKSTTGRREFFTVQWVRCSFQMIAADCLDELMPNPQQYGLRRGLNGGLPRCWTTTNTMARPSLLSNGKNTTIVTIVANGWNVSRRRWILFRPCGLTTCPETSFLLQHDSLLCSIPRRHLAGPIWRMKSRFIVAFSSPISKASMTTLDRRIAELLQVGFRFSVVDGNRCFVAVV